MYKIKHLSFDLWLTLLKSNPEFKIQKAFMFYDHYNPTKKSIEQVTAIMRAVDVQSTRLAEITGRNVNPLDMIGTILIQLEFESQRPITQEDLDNIFWAIQGLYLLHLPSPFDEDTIPCLTALYDSTEIMTIGSNTGFIIGDTIRKGLKKLGMLQFFRGEIFSDEVGVAKPSIQFFQAITELSNFNRSEILHVGDNPYADGYGAGRFGMQSMVINSNSSTIKHVVQYLT